MADIVLGTEDLMVNETDLTLQSFASSKWKTKIA